MSHVSVLSVCHMHWSRSWQTVYVCMYVCKLWPFMCLCPKPAHSKHSNIPTHLWTLGDHVNIDDYVYTCLQMHTHVYAFVCVYVYLYM